MELVVRDATPDDLNAMVDLLGLLFSQEADFQPDPDRQRQALSKILAARELGSVLVAQAQGKVVGMVSLLYTISTAEGGAAAWLEDMVVHPDFRGHGIGSLLLDAAAKTCRTKGVRRVTLLTDRSNAPAQRFYQRHGFVASAMTPYRRYY